MKIVHLVTQIRTSKKVFNSRLTKGGGYNQFQYFPILLYRKPNFLIFMRAHAIMTSQKPNAGHVGTYFGIGV